MVREILNIPLVRRSLNKWCLRMKRRNNVDIMADILRISRGGAKKTWIVYRANLNFNIVKKYLSELMEKGLLAAYKGSNTYQTTERGIEFLEQYDSFRKFHSSRSRRLSDNVREDTWLTYPRYVRR